VKTQYIIGVAITLLVGFLFYRIMLPFLVPVFWAVVLVILFFPYYRILLKKFGSATAASIMACVTIAVFLIVPMALIGTALANETYGLYQWVEGYRHHVSASTRSTSEVALYLQGIIAPYADLSAMEIQEQLLKLVQQGSFYIAQGLKGAIQNVAGLVINLLLAFFTMYFLFKDSDKLLRLIKDLIPLTQEETEKVLAKNRVIISATFTGGVLVGLAQGFLGGVAFWFLALPSPLLWGSLMFILSFLPAIGTALVIIPAVGYLVLIGSTTKGLILLGWGVFVVGMADNVLRPIIVSGKTNQHPLLLFLSILGAVNVFGMIGIVAGPIILSITNALIDIYRRSNHEEPNVLVTKDA
jgi:predicted PurR-regulated permease PerM